MHVVVDIPLRLVSAANLREHWRTRDRRVRAEREAAAYLCRTQPGWRPLAAGESVDVELLRIAPRALDDDNLAAAFKGVRDQVAAELGLAADNDPRASWHYHQQRGRPREYAIRITVTIAAPLRCPSTPSLS